MFQYRGSKQLPKEKHDQPSGTVLLQMRYRHIDVRLIQCFRTTDALHVLGILFVSQPEDIINGDDTQHNTLRIDHRKGYPIIHPEDIDRFLLWVVRIE